MAVLQQTDLKKFICLYTTSNYKWYLKQHLPLTSEHDVVSFEWVATTRSLFTLRILSGQEILTYTFKLAFCAGLESQTSSTCAVIDGLSVHLTPFDKVYMPPPMSHASVSVSNCVNFVVFDAEKSVLAVVDSDNEISIFDCTDTCLNKLSSYSIQKHSQTSVPLCLHHFYWNENRLFCVKAEESCRGDYPVILLSDDNGVGKDLEGTFYGTVRSNIMDIQVSTNLQFQFLFFLLIIYLYLTKSIQFYRFIKN